MAELNLVPETVYVTVTAADSIRLPEEGYFEFFTDESRTTPIDFTGSTWKAEIRTADALNPSPGTAPASFIVDAAQQNVGRLFLFLAKDVTQGLNTSLVYADLEQVSGSTKRTWLRFEITIEKQVSA